MGLGFTFEAEDEGLSDYMEGLSASLVSVSERLERITVVGGAIVELGDGATTATAAISEASVALRRVNEEGEKGGGIFERLVGYLQTKGVMDTAKAAKSTLDALGAGLKSPLDMAMKWEQAQRNLAGTTGMTTAEFEKFRGGAQELVARTGLGNQAILEMGIELKNAGFALDEFGTGANNVSQIGADLAAAYKMSTGQVTEFIVASRGLGVGGAGLRDVLDAGAALEKEFKVTGLIQEVPGLLDQVRQQAIQLGSGFGAAGKNVVKFSLSMAAAISKKLNVSMAEAAKMAGEALGGFVSLQDQFERAQTGMGDWSEGMDQAVEALVRGGMSSEDAVKSLSTMGTDAGAQRKVMEALAAGYDKAGGASTILGMRQRQLAQEILGQGAAAAIASGETEEFLKGLDKGMDAAADSAGAANAAVTEMFKGGEQQRGVFDANTELNKTLLISQDAIRDMANGFGNLNGVLDGAGQSLAKVQASMAESLELTKQMKGLDPGSDKYKDLAKQLAASNEQFASSKKVMYAAMVTATDLEGKMGLLASTETGGGVLKWLEGVVKESPMAAVSLTAVGSVLGAIGLKAIFAASKIGGVYSKLKLWIKGGEEAATSGSKLGRMWTWVTTQFGKLAKIGPKITGFFGKLYTSVIGVAGQIGSLGGRFTGLFKVGGRLAGVTNVFKFLGKALGKVLVPISFIIAGFEALTKNWDNLKAAFDGELWSSDWVAASFNLLNVLVDTVWDFLDSLTFGLFGAIFDPLTDMLTNTVGAIRGLFGATDKAAQDSMAWIDTLAGGFYDVLIDPLVQGAKWIWSGFEWLWSKLGDFTGWLDGMFDGAVDSFAGFVQGIPKFFGDMWKSITGFFTSNPLGDWFSSLSPVTSVIDAIGGKLTSLGEAWDTVYGGVKKLVNYIFVGESPSLIDAFTIPFELLSKAIDFVMAPLNMLWGAFKFLGTSILSFFEDPLGSVEGLVDQVVGFVLAIPENLKAAFAGGADLIGDFFGVDPTAVISGFSSAVDGAVDYVLGMFDKVTGIASSAFDFMVGTAGKALGFLSDLWEGVFNSMSDVVGSVFGGIANFFSDPMGAIKGHVEGVVDFVLELPDTIKNAFSEVASSIGDMIGIDPTTIIDTFSKTVDDVVNLVSGAFDQVTGFVSGLFSDPVGTIKDALADGLNFILDLPGMIVDEFSKNVIGLGDLIGFDGKAVVKFLDPVLSFFKQLPDRVLKFVSGIPGHVASIWTGLVTGVTTKFSEIVTFFTSLPARLSTGFTALTAWVGEKKDAIAKKFEGWIDAIKEVFSGIADWIKDKLGLGADGALTKVMEKATAVKETVSGVMSDPLGAASDASASLLEKASSTLSDTAGSLKGAASGVYDGTVGAGLSLLGFAEGGIVKSPTIGMIGELSAPEAVVPLTSDGISKFIQPVMAQVNMSAAGMGMFSDFSPAYAESPQVVTIGPDGEVSSATDQEAIDAVRSVFSNMSSMPGELMAALAEMGAPPATPAASPVPAANNRLKVQISGKLHANLPVLNRALYAVVEDAAGAAGMGVMGGG